MGVGEFQVAKVAPLIYAIYVAEFRLIKTMLQWQSHLHVVNKIKCSKTSGLL